MNYSKIDWKQLKQQKLTLIALQIPGITEEQSEDLDGILNLIDHIQDSAFETGKFEHDQIYLTEAELNLDNCGIRLIKAY
jgi:hypothetical protein